MRTRRYVLAAVVVLGILLVAGWVLRNTLIERLSGPLLAEYDLQVTDVSLDGLATSGASFGHIEIEHRDGMVIDIENLRLPISATPDGRRVYAADRISIALAPAGTSPDYAGIIDRVLGLPVQVPETDIQADVIEIDGQPPIADARWRSDGERQSVALRVAGYSLAGTLGPGEEGAQRAEITLADADGRAQPAAVDILEVEAGYEVAATSRVELSWLTPLAGLAGVTGMNFEDGEVELSIGAAIPRDGEPVEIEAGILPVSPLAMSIEVGAGEIASMTLASAGQFEGTYTPGTDSWKLAQPNAQLSVNYLDWQSVQLGLLDLECRSGPQCTGGLRVEISDAPLPTAVADSISVAAELTVTASDDGIEVDVAPGANFEIAGIAANDYAVARFEGELTSAASLSNTDNGWRFAAASLNAGIDRLQTGRDVLYSAPLYLDELNIAESDAGSTMTVGFYAAAGEIQADGRSWSLPGFNGGLSRQGADIALLFRTNGLFRDLEIELNHDLDRSVGSVVAAGGAVSFERTALSGRARPWLDDWDVSGGTAEVGFAANWREADDAWRIEGDGFVALAGITGKYRDIAFLGLQTRIDASFDSADGLAFAPNALAIDLLEVGMPLTDIAARLQLGADLESIDVEGLRMSLLGGTLRADPFSYRTASNVNTLVLHAESIDLSAAVAVQEFESVEVSGRIGAVLPVTLENDRIRIDGGTLTGEAPGGVIRYLPGLGTNEEDATGLGIATRALSNFEYDSLSSALDYTTDGDMVLKMRIAGRNPDLEDGRPVVLNLGVENNVPQMLRSLRAARKAEEIIERRLAQ